MKSTVAPATALMAALVGGCGSAGPTVPALPATTVDLKSSLSASFDALAIPAGAACSMSISQHGQVLLERGRGQIAPGRQASVDSLYRIASLTKPITASAILVSERADRLSRSDKVNQFLAFPEPAPTIDELIKHVPGLPNYLDTPAYQSGRTSPTTVETLLSLIQPWDGVRRYQYSNSHAILSGAVLQKVNGMTYEEVVQRDIFGPAGMSRSSFALPPASESFQFPSSTHPTWVYAAGGVTSTAADMNRFNQALLSNLFGFGAVESFDRSAKGVTSFGMGSGATDGDLRFTHAGGLDTYSSFSIMFPADRSSVVLLCNFNDNNPDGQFNFVMGLRSIMLAAASPAPQKPAATAADWPQWRGPNRDGAVLTALPDEWPTALKKRWEIAVGAGHASPVVSGNRVVVIARQNDQEIVRALDVTSGREIWRAAYPAPYKINQAAWAHGPGPKSTPAIGGGRVFTLGIGGILSAFDLASGTLIWRLPAPGVLPQYGTATSPLVDGPNVIAHVGGDESGALTSFDAATGTPRWQWKGDGPGYGSPIIATLGGVRQVIAQTHKFLVGVNASNGALLWRLPFANDFDQNAFTPIIFQDFVINTGVDEPLTAIRPKLSGDTWITETVWTNPQTPMFLSSPVIIGETIYGLTTRNKGQFVAIDARSGKTLWTTQGREGENASMLGRPSWLLASTTDGILVVARANPQKYEEVRRYRIADSALWAHPAITGNSIIVKDVDKVICWSF